jgi:hypothetical protein
LGVLALLAGAGVLLHVNLGQRDRRFKTGYKNNQVPTQMAAGPRLKWTAILWVIGGLCLANAAVLSGLAIVAACIGGAWIAWTQYPRLWARFQGGAPRNSAFVAARWSLCAAAGGSTAYATALMIGLGAPSAATPPVASAPTAISRSAKASASAPEKRSASASNNRVGSAQRFEPAEEILETTRRASPPVVMPVEVQRSVPILGPVDPVPNRSLEAAAVRAPAGTRSPVQRERDEEHLGGIEDDDAAPDDRSPRDLRALGPMRGVAGVRGPNVAPGTSFNQRFPYTPPAQQRSPDVANAEPSGRGNTYAPIERAQAGRLQPERVPVERGVVVPQRQSLQRYTAPRYEAPSERLGPQGDGP